MIDLEGCLSVVIWDLGAHESPLFYSKFQKFMIYTITSDSEWFVGNMHFLDNLWQISVFKYSKDESVWHYNLPNCKREDPCSDENVWDNVLWWSYLWANSKWNFI